MYQNNNEGYLKFDTYGPQPRFRRGEVAFTKKDHEKVVVLKPLNASEDDRNVDLGQLYLLRGNDNKIFRLYEFELLTAEEANASL
jgi:hypothetical protein